MVNVIEMAFLLKLLAFILCSSVNIKYL